MKNFVSFINFNNKIFFPLIKNSVYYIMPPSQVSMETMLEAQTTKFGSAKYSFRWKDERVESFNIFGCISDRFAHT